MASSSRVVAQHELHTTIKMTTFQALYGYSPPQLAFDSVQTPVAAVETWMTWMEAKQQCIEVLKHNLEMAQNRMKQFADRQRSERHFEVGDWVYLKRQPYRQTSVAIRRNLKLSSKYYRPYRVLQKIGNAAYKLELPEGTSIHPVFHVSLLKPSAKKHSVTVDLPLTTSDGHLKVAPEVVLDTRTITRGRQKVAQVLVKWLNLSKEDVTWEDVTVIRSQFPEFLLNPSDLRGGYCYDHQNN
ncbi:uncharacterized protein [Coffea arabica]|uniref:Chromo domain-containing protein n=1 Tax=Coffea arabica TaxID=13443 RepID=A0A6P6V8V8_COFAR|nr:uncharacterized protein LOC113718434 [Coffea arabica]